MKKKILVAICVCLLLTGLGWVAVAVASPTEFTLSWWTVDGGGGRSQGDGFVLNGTAGQPDAGFLTGPGYTLGGGFWAGGELAVGNLVIYLPLVIR